MTQSNSIQKVNLEEYKKSIESLANNRDSMIFMNSGNEHAAIVMGNIFKHSKQDIRIFAGNLNGAVSGDDYYQEHLSNFLDSGGKLKILLQEFDKNNPPEIFNLFSSVDFFYPENVEIKLSNTTLVSEDTETKVHFTVGDSSMYRIENDVEKYLAKGSFNNPDKANYLIEIFDEIFEETENHIL
jgi:hypothetical protein